MTDYRNVTSAFRITLKSLGRRYLELHDEIADLDTMIVAIAQAVVPRAAASGTGAGFIDGEPDRVETN